MLETKSSSSLPILIRPLYVVIKGTAIITINCHQLGNTCPTACGWCGRAAPRSREGERDNCCVSGWLKDRSADVAGDSNEEVVEDLEVEIKKELVDE